MSSADRSKVVCICVSLLFQNLFESGRRRLAELGMIVLAPEMIDGELTLSRLESLGKLYLRLIDMSDGVRLVSQGGYLGLTTRREISYVWEKRKSVISMNPVLDL